MDNTHARLSLHGRVLFFISLVLGSIVTSSAWASSNEARCSAMEWMDFSQLDEGNAAAKVTHARYVSGQALSEDDAALTHMFSELMAAPIPKATRTLPAHCILDGYVNPTIKFQIRLPISEDWNGRYLLASCDGFCGEVETHRAMAGLARQYATLTHDGGHSAYGFDAVWAKGNLGEKIDFAHRANHVLAIVGKALVKAYYQQPAKYSIIAGCSKGGQAGVMAAQRYPEDFDGVIARGPTINYTKVNLISCMDNAKAIMGPNEQALMDVSYLDTIRAAAMASCDEADGLKDGLITDPRLCQFDPATLACDAGVQGQCLTAQQVRAVEELYAPSIGSNGEVLYGGLPMGSETEWYYWVLPEAGSPEKPWHYYAATEYMKYIAYPTEKKLANWRDFNYQQEQNRLAEIAIHFDADNPDLRLFRDRGGKMIVLHGWADAAIPAHASVKWYEEVSRFMGGNQEVEKFARMFLLPGVSHCDSSGPGPGTVDGMAALERWLESGTAPDKLITAKLDEKDAVVRTRPVYPYPLIPQYKGTGDIDKAENFKSVLYEY
ncbi:tannase/feruloyl esterase family alpha/beta hydrolase [Alteromonas sp. C1M14]|uniref:tannase/feruloyl esterase family alpha/beta hydrolase n=1 Tax=Alteromonas sp. C1M14 TaxID=2841567 RepID=UPI001C0896D0|nr:tannase/feruloyl esterase family alpha/beta hydrolase [Alteromonas sp. C1M14]MBU2978546.1 tannase/feruloyl esterase family alpha/beta hydrolase [Alteromonas sp. C1M14]